jgi:hypothetical protein
MYWTFPQSDHALDILDHCFIDKESRSTIANQSTEGTEFVWVSECQKGEGSLGTSLSIFYVLLFSKSTN